MPEELNSENDIEKVLNTVEGESLEGIKPETQESSEVSTETKEAVKPENTPDAETIALIKSIREEVGDKRFNGLMSSWQKDRSDLLKYREKEKTPSTTSQDGNDDALIEYLDKKLEAKRLAREQELQSAAQKEVDEARTIYPQFSETQLFETANKLSTPGKPVSLMTAAIHLSELDNAIKTRGQVTADEIAKKQKAGTIAGRSGVQNSTGIRKYDPEKDSKKSIGELIEEGFKDFG
jgi:hypothetical protein